MSRANREMVSWVNIMQKTNETEQDLQSKFLKWQRTQITYQVRYNIEEAKFDQNVQRTYKVQSIVIHIKAETLISQTFLPSCKNVVSATCSKYSFSII